jgi:transketolase
MKGTKLTTRELTDALKRLLQMHYESGVGHIGGNLSSLDAMLLLHHEYLRTERDQFILSKGHSAGALYVTLWSKGLLSDDDLKRFHKEETNLPAHPPASGIPGILFATGSLGHGLSLAAGTALAKRLNSDAGHVYCMTSDGEWQEGSTWEALIFLCHHKLTNLTILVDHNTLQGFGSTDAVASMNPLADKLRGFAITIQSVDGHDLEAIRVALDTPSSQPKLIILNTTKGRGVSFMEKQMGWHYLPLNEDQYKQALSEIESEINDEMEVAES